jgi:hypothetical protein
MKLDLTLGFLTLGFLAEVVTRMYAMGCVLVPALRNRGGSLTKPT